MTLSTRSLHLTTVVLDVSGVHYATEKAVVETVLSHRPGVHGVDGHGDLRSKRDLGARTRTLD